VLDVMLPDCDGFTLARQLRATHAHLPVLFLTARGSVDDRIAGLTAGSDDYVTKPCSQQELVLRLKAILRRTQLPRNRQPQGTMMTYADLALDEEAHEVRRAGTLVALSPTEFNLLRYLMVNAGKVVSKTQILDRVWNCDFGGDSRIVESYISYLRRKIDRQEPTTDSHDPRCRVHTATAPRCARRRYLMTMPPRPLTRTAEIRALK
jgi:two-component system OmpR family response regulator